MSQFPIGELRISGSRYERLLFQVILEPSVQEKDEIMWGRDYFSQK